MGDELLACASFALNQNGRGGGRNRANQVQCFLQSRAAPDDSFKFLLLREVFVGKAHACEVLRVRKSNIWSSQFHPPTPSLHSALTTSPRLVKPCEFLSWSYGTNSVIRTTPDGVPRPLRG